MQRVPFLVFASGLMALSVSACYYLTDGSTRVGLQLASGASDLPKDEGSRYTVTGITPAMGNECIGPYRVQFDKAGGIFVWCYDNDSPKRQVAGGGSTTHAVAYVDTLKTWFIDRSACATFSVELQRRHGRPVIVGVYY